MLAGPRIKNSRDFQNKSKPYHKKRRSAGGGGHQLKPGVFRVESLSAIRDFLLRCPEKILGIWCDASCQEKVRGGLQGVEVPDFQLPEAGSEIPFWAEISLDPLTEKQFLLRLSLEERPSVLLALDHVTDPRNLGAIARSAAYFGVRYILLPKDRQVGLSHASVNTSQGAFAWTELVQVVNLSRTLRTLKKEYGYWTIACEKSGCEPEAHEGPLDPVVLVLGNEEKGLSALIQRQCDFSLGIKGVDGCMDSLNVSVAAGVMLRALIQRQKK